MMIRLLILMRKPTILFCLFAVVAPAVGDDFIRLHNEILFRKKIAGKTLENDDFTINIFNNNRISGSYKNSPIQGLWIWKNNWLCQDITISGKYQGVDCQTVEIFANTVRITPDNGRGEAVDYRLVE